MIRSLRVYVTAVLGTLWYGAGILLRSAFRTRGLERACRENPRRWSRMMLRAAGVRVDFENLERVMLPEGRILVANHVSWYDVFALAAHLPVEYCFIAKKELERIPVFGPAWQACGHISIDRADLERAIQSLSEAARQIREREVTIVMFPEGTRSPTGRMRPFKKGAFVLAIEAGVPIVPVGILGSRQIMPKGSWRIRPGTIRVRVGEPIPVQGMDLGDRDRLVRTAEAAVAQLLEQGQEENEHRSVDDSRE